MEATAQLIAEDIDSGKYFLEARHWYNRLYLQPLSEVSMVLSLAVLFLCISLMIAYNLYSVFPVTKKVNTVVMLPNTLNVHPIITSISQPDKSTRQVIAEYLCGRYVKAREGYDYNNLVYGYNFIFRSSTKELFDMYYKGLAISNPNSPIVLYRDHKTIRINIIDTQQLEDDTVVVKFTATINNHKGKVISHTAWIANLSFYLSNYNYQKPMNSKLDFIITKYDVKQVVKQQENGAT